VRIEIVDEASTRELRRSVLRPNLAPGDPLPGDDLDGGVHFGAVEDDGMVACTCFVYPDPCPFLPDAAAPWHLRQMATLPDRRGQGIGGLVVEAAAAFVRDQGAGVLWCNAREPAVAFYARHGFRPWGPIFTDERHTIPHQRMWREFPPG
jgi:GNAT superfamily N-acetyltransferase